MPREFAHLCFAIDTSSEEEAMPENSNNLSYTLAMYASSNKHSNNSQFSHIIMVDLTKEEAKTILTEAEVEEDTPTMMVEVNNSSFTHLNNNNSFTYLNFSRITLLIKPLSLVAKTSRVIDLFAKFVERRVI